MNNNFYKIEKSDEFFEIRRTENLFIMLKLSRTKYDKIFQHNHVLLAKLATGGYDFYLPSTTYDMHFHKCYVVDRPLTLVASNISEYLTYQDIFAFKKDSDWKFLFLYNFEIELDLNVSSLENRLSKLPSIPCEENTSASFKAGFEALYPTSYPHNRRCLAIFSTDKDYLICAERINIPLDCSSINITYLGTATMLSGGDGHFFKAKNDFGESWYQDQYSDNILYGSIAPMKEAEYPSIYPSKDFSGYWKKDHDGFIIAFTFLSNSDHTSFSLCLPCPAKKVKFAKTINRMNLHDGTDMVKTATLWKMTSTNDEDLFLLVSDNNYVTLPSNFA